MDTLYIVMPAYNEEENIEKVLRDWYLQLKGKGTHSRIVIADEGSTDHTHAILENLQKTHPQLEVLRQTEKEHGSKLIALYNYAVNKGADYIFQTDSDGQTNSAEFNVFWESRADYDVILGYRPVRGDGKVRAFVEKIVCYLIRIYFKIWVPDANAPFRLMKTSVVQKYLKRLPENYNLPNIMLTTYFTYYKEKVAFKKISFKPRQGGVNSVNFFKIIKIGWKALKDFRMFQKEMNF